MDRQVSSVARLATAALIVGMVVTACAGHGGAQATAGSTPAPATQAGQVDQAAAAASSPSAAAAAGSATPASSVIAGQSSGAASSGAASSGSATTSGAPKATPDPLTGQISNLNNILNGINSSLSGSDAGTSGGE